jgi:hypothetical protein
MRSVPKQVYHKEPSRQSLLSHVGATDPDLLATTEDQELPDATLTGAQRRAMKKLVHEVEAHRSSHELMFLAGAFEDAAHRKRAEEEREKKGRRASGRE